MFADHVFFYVILFSIRSLFSLIVKSLHTCRLLLFIPSHPIPILSVPSSLIFQTRIYHWVKHAIHKNSTIPALLQIIFLLLSSLLLSSRDFPSRHSISNLFVRFFLVCVGEEIVSGAQRIHDVTLLTERAEHWKVITYISTCILGLPTLALWPLSPLLDLIRELSLKIAS